MDTKQFTHRRHLKHFSVVIALIAMLTLAIGPAAAHPAVDQAASARFVPTFAGKAGLFDELDLDESDDDADEDDNDADDNNDADEDDNDGDEDDNDADEDDEDDEDESDDDEDESDDDEDENDDD